MSKKSVLATFTVAVLALLNKSEEQIQQEQVEDFRESCLIEANSQVELIKAENQRLGLELKKKNRDLEVSSKKLESTKFSVANDYTAYFNKVEVVNHEIKLIKNSISDLESQILANDKVAAQHLDNIKLFS